METQVIAAIVGGLIAIAGAAASHLYRTRHEKSATNRAVLAEINRLLFVLRRSEAFWSGRMKANNTDCPLIPFTSDVYHALVEKIGVIDESIIVPVVKFYGYVGYLNALLSMRPQFKVSMEFDQQYLQSLQTILADYNSAFDGAFNEYGVAPL